MSFWQDTLFRRQWLLFSFFIAQLFLTAALLLFARILKGCKLLATPKIEFLPLGFFSRLTLSTFGIWLDWHSFSTLALNLPGQRLLPPSLRPVVESFVVGPWRVFWNFVGSQAVNVAVLSSLMLFLLTVVPILLISSLFKRELFLMSKGARCARFLSRVVNLVPLPGEALHVVEELCGVLLLPCLTSILRILVCGGEDCQAAPVPTVLIYVASAVLASYLPFVYASGVWLRLTETLPASSLLTDPKLVKSAGHLLLERPMKVLAVGVMILGGSFEICSGLI